MAGVSGPANSRFKDITGQRFGRLIVLSYSGSGSGSRWLCRCDCGTEKEVSGSHLRSGKTKGCGCVRVGNLRHGLRGNPIWGAWWGMIKRCEYPSESNYERYGGRGIRVCERWRSSVEAFYADMGDRPDGCELDRIDTNGNYEPENCRWVTRKENCRNRRSNHYVTAFGETRCLAEWQEKTGINWSTISGRLRNGWTPERAVTEAVACDG